MNLVEALSIVRAAAAPHLVSRSEKAALKKLDAKIASLNLKAARRKPASPTTHTVAPFPTVVLGWGAAQAKKDTRRN